MNAKVKSKKTGAIFVVSCDDFDPKKHDLLLSPCDESVTKKEDIKVEVIVDEDLEKQDNEPVCSVCGKVFKNVNGLRLHGKVHK